MNNLSGDHEILSWNMRFGKRCGREEDVCQCVCVCVCVCVCAGVSISLFILRVLATGLVAVLKRAGVQAVCV